MVIEWLLSQRAGLHSCSIEDSARQQIEQEAFSRKGSMVQKLLREACRQTNTGEKVLF